MEFEVDWQGNSLDRVYRYLWLNLRLLAAPWISLAMLIALCYSSYATNWVWNSEPTSVSNSTSAQKQELSSGGLTYLAQGIPWSSRRFPQVETVALHLAQLKLAISPNVGDSGAEFLVGGDCVRASPTFVQTKTTPLNVVHSFELCDKI